MANIKIAVINSSTVVNDIEVQALTQALQIQVSRDFAPVWGVDADLVFVPNGTQPPAGTWWLTILDNTDQAGALGYHDLTPDSLPLGKVFAGTDKQYGSQWTVTASHELLEMLGDPDINLCASVSNADGSIRLYAYEVADACEADSYGYQINSLLVSDFVYPAWFESFRQPGSTQFDFQNKITTPFQLLPGGYIGICDVNSTNGWTQLTAAGVNLNYASRPHVGSRRERRRIPRNHWVKTKLTTHLSRRLKKGRLKTFRNPVFSLLQSALHESLKRRRGSASILSAEYPEMQDFSAAAETITNAARTSLKGTNNVAAAPTGAAPLITASIGSTVLTCAERLAQFGWAEITGNSARSQEIVNELKTSSCDAAWIDSVTTYLAWKASGSSLPYIPYKNLGDFVLNLPTPQTGKPLVVGVIADWGTGTEDAQWLVQRVMAQNVDLIIHLGDIYYSGTPSETTENFTNLLKGINVPIFTLSGNHDMYSGGVGYYGLLQQLHQPASFFCLRNADWQILAMDTGYNDHNVFTVNTNITSLYEDDSAAKEADWHLDKINNAGGRRTILLSHHQLFDPYDDGIGQDSNGNYLATNPKLLNVFAPVLGNVALWLWGHAHSLNIYQPYVGLAKGRCVGASAVPVDDPSTYTQNKSLVLDPAAKGQFPQLVNDSAGNPIMLSRNSDGDYFHCFCLLRLAPAGSASTAEYYQIDSTNNGQESLIYSENL